MVSFAFELVSPEKVLYSGEAESVVVPAAEGDLTVLANHAPFMSAMRAGIVIVDGAKRLYVRGGFCDVSAKGLTLLAEQAVPVEDINAEKLAGDIKNAEDDLRDAKTEEACVKASEKLDQLKAMMAAIRN